jgi:hypothetical protein
LSDPDTQRRLDLPNGDWLIPDEDCCEQELDGCTTRTAQKYDAEGCPHVYLRGRKWRPVLGVREWKASRIVRKQPKRTTRPYAARAATAAT